MSDDKDMRNLIDSDFERVERKLSNGSASDPAVQGEALAMILKHVRILVRRNTVTEEDCTAKMAACPARQPVQASVAPVMTTAGAQAMTHIFKDLPPWLVIGGYFVAKANGWIQ